MSFLYSIIGFVIAIGVLVAVHEFGHFWVARKLGVKVLTFSIGFGKPIWRKVAGPDQTEYIIARIPLGGYVKMLGEGSETEPVDPKEAHRAFDNQPIWKRSLIVVAGPAINFLFAILLFMMLGLQTEQHLEPTFGNVTEQSILAQSGVNAGDTLISVDGKPARFLAEHDLYVFNQVLKRQPIELEIESNGRRSNVTIATSDIPIYKVNPASLMRQLGFVGVQPEITTDIERVAKGSPAESGGLKVGDKFVSIDQIQITSWRDLTAAVQPAAGQPLLITVERDGANVSMTITPKSINVGNATYGQLGVGPTVLPPRPEQIIEINRSPLAALTHGVNQTWLMSTLTLRMLGKMITLQVSHENVNGPLMIADVAGQAIQVSFSTYLYFLALISISLGVMNLLPIPMLDGGHLASYVIEVFAGKRFAQKAFITVQPFGLLMLAGLMSLAFYNDILKIFN
ncbi:MAG: regulator of sigma E protease [Arenicella sp.]